MRDLEDFDVKNKRVLVRCDFNVPLDAQGNILDDFRIKRTLPTIQYLMKKGARIILMSHLGRPDGKVVESLRLTPIQDRLMEYLDVSITKAPDCLGSEIKKWIAKMQPGEILLLENIQFHPGEKANDQDFAETLASYADIFVFEAFGQAHRNYASIASIPKYLPCLAGFLLKKEVDCLTRLSTRLERPFLAVISGKKVKTKVKVIDKISENADFILVNGLIKKEIDDKNIKFKYPEKIIAPVDEVGDGKDIGPKTIELFKQKISEAKTILWSGPLGKIEQEEFSRGSEGIARAIIESGAFSVAGGGETVKFINQLSLAEKFDHLSTGGGAALKFLAGEELPGIKALE